MEKYEYLTGEDLGHKPSVSEKATFEYSPLDMILTNNTENKMNADSKGGKQEKNITNIWYIIHNSNSEVRGYRWI